MLRAVKIRLYPNKEQSTMINKLIGCYRVVYNQCLNRKIESYKNGGKSENLSTLGLFVHHELLKEVAEKYSGKTIDSVIEDIDSKIKEADKQWE